MYWTDALAMNFLRQYFSESYISYYPSVQMLQSKMMSGWYVLSFFQLEFKYNDELQKYLAPLQAYT